MITACPSVRQELKPYGKSLAVVRVIGLAAPAERQLGGERGVDEPGDGHGVRAIGIPVSPRPMPWHLQFP